MTDDKKPNKASGEADRGKPITTCGVVMPIADFNPYPTGHWIDVYSIIEEAIEDAGFSAKMVSSDDAVGVIQQRIVQNLYENEIVVVDVSGRNANVMFELGMRLAFDKPVVIVKDEVTPYNFDTAPIEHIGYRSDLHYQSTLSFKKGLSEKLRHTYEASQKTNYTAFLKHFGNFIPSTIEKKEVSELNLVMSELTSIRRELRSQRSWAGSGTYLSSPPFHLVAKLPSEVSKAEIAKLQNEIGSMGLASGGLDYTPDGFVFSGTAANRSMLLKIGDVISSRFPAAEVEFRSNST